MNDLELFFEELIDFIDTTRIEKIPLFYYDALLNYLSVTLKGAKLAPLDNLIRTLQEDHQGNYYPLNRQEKVSLSDCVLIDCFSSSLLAYDDIHYPTSTHPCGPVASALLALARKQRVSIHNFLEALCIGMEVECRVGLLMFSNNQSAWYTTGIVGGIGAAVACGKILNFNKQQYKNAISIACNQASGIRGSHGSIIGSMVPAFASQNGYLACVLTVNNITCHENSFIGNNGLIYSITSNPNVALAKANLKERLISMETVCKPYPYGFISFACIDIIKNVEIDLFNLKSIKVEVSPMVKRLGANYHPKSLYDGIVSLPYLIARTMLDKNSIYKPLTEEFYVTKKEVELINKIEIIVVDNLNDNEAKITIIDNKNNHILLPPNDNKMEHHDVINKFKKLIKANNQWINDFYHKPIEDIYRFIIEQY